MMAMTLRAVVFNAKLAALVKATKPALDHLPVAAAEGAVKAAVEEAVLFARPTSLSVIANQTTYVNFKNRRKEIG